MEKQFKKYLKYIEEGNPSHFFYDGKYSEIHEYAKKYNKEHLIHLAQKKCALKWFNLGVDGLKGNIPFFDIKLFNDLWNVIFDMYKADFEEDKKKEIKINLKLTDSKNREVQEADKYKDELSNKLNFDD